MCRMRSYPGSLRCICLSLCCPLFFTGEDARGCEGATGESRGPGSGAGRGARPTPALPQTDRDNARARILSCVLLFLLLVIPLAVQAPHPLWSTFQLCRLLSHSCVADAVQQQRKVRELEKERDRRRERVRQARELLERAQRCQAGLAQADGTQSALQQRWCCSR